MLGPGVCCVTSEQEELLFTVICFRSMLSIGKRGKAVGITRLGKGHDDLKKELSGGESQPHC